MKNSWNLDQLKAQLRARKEIKGWILQQEHVHRRERYFMLDGKVLVTDQDREVASQNLFARIFVKLSKPGRQGEIMKKLFFTQPLEPQLDAAVAAALQTDHQAWELPTVVPSNVATLKTTDPRMAEDLNGVLEQVTERISQYALKPRQTSFNSSELFLSVHDREDHLSNGLVHRSSQSRVYAEAAFSYRKGTSADEYLSTRWSVNLDDLELEKMFDETSERAQRSLDVEKPATGKYPVIIDADVLATLFDGHVSQLTAANAYNSLPFLKPGEEFIPGASGDLITLTLDPTLDFGADTAPLSEQGLPQEKIKLVENNQVKATLSDKQYSDYLAMRPTSVRGSVVLEAGSLSHDELTKQAPRVLEILQFSGLFADPNSGTFSSEIRLGRVFERTPSGEMKSRYIKGGSLSGSITENFKNAKFSNHRVKRAMFSANSLHGQGYFGPEYALLSDVSIVG